MKVSFHEALRILRCDPGWLSRMIDSDRIPVTIVAGKYYMEVDQVRALIQAPTPKGEPRLNSTIERKARLKAEMVQEARAAGMSWEEYRAIVLEASCAK